MELKLQSEWPAVMKDLVIPTLEKYMERVFRKPVRVLGIRSLGETTDGGSIKTYGYGTPMRIDYQCPGEPISSLVLHTTRPSPFGHQHMADRAQGILWAHQSFNRLPRHAKSVDVGAFRRSGALASLGDAEEFFLLSDYVEGAGYNMDLERIRDTDMLTGLDLKRADALCAYLADIHREPKNEPSLYSRRIRELIGHGECIMGLIDSYPPHPQVSSQLLEKLEMRCVQWRWKLKDRAHRLRQVHGDFHPWNILFADGTNFHVLDRSRGEWGDPADDVACLTANYLFFSLQRFQRMQGALNTLFQRFWREYLERTGDQEMRSVVAPFFAFRGLVMASPLWYPELADGVRKQILLFVDAVLRHDEFHPEEVNEYLIE